MFEEGCRGVFQLTGHEFAGGAGYASEVAGTSTKSEAAEGRRGIASGHGFSHWAQGRTVRSEAGIVIGQYNDKVIADPSSGSTASRRGRARDVGERRWGVLTA